MLGTLRKEELWPTHHSEKYPGPRMKIRAFAGRQNPQRGPTDLRVRSRVISVIFICLWPRRDAPSSWPEGNL